MFGRVFSEPITFGDRSESSILHFFFTPEEADLIALPRRNIIPLDAEIVNGLGYSSRSMADLVENPVEMFYSVIREFVREAVSDFLAANHVSLAPVNTPSLRYMISVKATAYLIERLLKLVDDPNISDPNNATNNSIECQNQNTDDNEDNSNNNNSKNNNNSNSNNSNNNQGNGANAVIHSFLKGIHELVSTHQVQFLSSLSIRSIFAPVRTTTIEQLKSTRSYTLTFVRATMSSVLSRFRAIIYELQRERALILNGEKKDKLVDWWLEYINNRVETYLAEHGYHVDAIPYDYLDKAPESLELVHQNRVWLENFLGLLAVQPIEGQPPTAAHALVSEIKDQVLPFVYEFWRSAKVTVVDVMNTGHPVLGDEPDLQHMELESIIELVKDPEQMRCTDETIDTLTIENLEERLAAWQSSTVKPDPSLVRSVSGIIKDLEYIEEMLYLEDNQPTPGEGLQLGVVPISGLIVGRLYRYENEVVTVLDHWDSIYRRQGGSAAPPVTSSSSPPPPAPPLPPPPPPPPPPPAFIPSQPKSTTRTKSFSILRPKKRQLRRNAAVWGKVSLTAAGISPHRLSLMPSEQLAQAISQSKIESPRALRSSDPREPLIREVPFPLVLDNLAKDPIDSDLAASIIKGPPRPPSYEAPPPPPPPGPLPEPEPFDAALDSDSPFPFRSGSPPSTSDAPSPPPTLSTLVETPPLAPLTFTSTLVEQADQDSNQAQRWTPLAVMTVVALRNHPTNPLASHRDQ